MWNDNTVSQNDTSSIACKSLFACSIDHIGSFSLANTFNAVTSNADRERSFNERLLVSLGFVKVRRKIILLS